MCSYFLTTFWGWAKHLQRVPNSSANWGPWSGPSTTLNGPNPLDWQQSVLWLPLSHTDLAEPKWVQLSKALTSLWPVSPNQNQGLFWDLLHWSKTTAAAQHWMWLPVSSCILKSKWSPHLIYLPYSKTPWHQLLCLQWKCNAVNFEDFLFKTKEESWVCTVYITGYCSLQGNY